MADETNLDNGGLGSLDDFKNFLTVTDRPGTNVVVVKFEQSVFEEKVNEMCKYIRSGIEGVINAYSNRWVDALHNNGWEVGALMRIGTEDKLVDYVQQKYKGCANASVRTPDGFLKEKKDTA